jgi:hypothetical protein
LFKELEILINDFYEKNNVINNKGKLKEIKLKTSSLTTPKGGIDDFLDNPFEFPYVKMKVNNFNAVIGGIDFKITRIGEIIKI